MAHQAWVQHLNRELVRPIGVCTIATLKSIPLLEGIIALHNVIKFVVDALILHWIRCYRAVILENNVTARHLITITATEVGSPIEIIGARVIRRRSVEHDIVWSNEGRPARFFQSDCYIVLVVKPDPIR